MLFEGRANARQSASSGFALAMTPIASTVLATDLQGLLAGDVAIPSSTGQVPGYRAGPQAPRGGKAPVLLLAHEIFGVHEHIKDLCRRFAQQGYLAIAPDLFARQGDASKIADMQQLKAQIVGPTPDAQVIEDLDATLAWAAREPHADVSRLALTGFCWGGRMAWTYAAHQPALKAAVAWYGHLDGERQPLHPSYPLDLVDELKAPVLGLYGGKDPAIALQSVERMQSALSQSENAHARASQIHVYPDAGHAFAADYRPGYRQADAEDGFHRCYAWLQAHGAGPG